MAKPTPNLNAIVGHACALLLVEQAGGLSNLAATPSSNLRGALIECDLLANVPMALRNKIVRMIRNKAALAARVDCFGDDATGRFGARMRGLLESNINNEILRFRNQVCNLHYVFLFLLRL